MRWSVALSSLMAIASAVPAAAQVIQLPSFHSFSINTTVVVPDSGARPLAGTRRGRAGSSRFGGVPQRSAGIEREAAGAAVLAQVHDPQQTDLALRQEAQARRAGKAARVPVAQARPADRDEPLAGADSRLKSVAQIERERAAQRAAADREARLLVERARAAKAAGKPKVAAIYYATAAGKAKGALKQEIEVEWRGIDRSAANGNRAGFKTRLGEGDSPRRF